VERTNSPSVDDLRLFLDPMLNERSGVDMGRAETLPSAQHAYFLGDGEGAAETSRTGSMFLLLQNESGRSRFDVRDASVVVSFAPWASTRIPQMITSTRTSAVCPRTITSPALEATCMALRWLWLLFQLPCHQLAIMQVYLISCVVDEHESMEG
jgi:hypothetical protein